MFLVLKYKRVFKEEVCFNCDIVIQKCTVMCHQHLLGNVMHRFA